MTNTLLKLTRTALYTLAAGLAVLILLAGFAETLACPSINDTAIQLGAFFLAALVGCCTFHLGMVAESALWRREHEAAMTALYKQSSHSL